MEYYETKIGKIIENEFDSRLSMSVFDYIFSYGYDNIKKLNIEDAEKMESKEICIALVKCAICICQKCDVDEIMEYIRKYTH